MRENKLAVLKPLKGLLEEIKQMCDNTTLKEGYFHISEVYYDENGEFKYEFSAPYQETEAIIKEVGLPYICADYNGWQNEVWYSYGIEGAIIEYYFCAYHNKQRFQFSYDYEFSLDDYNFICKILENVNELIADIENK